MKIEHLEAFGFDGTNPLWDALLAHTQECIQDEIETAISRETLGEHRIHAAGRAEALNDFLVSVHQLREEALRRRG
ncbi:MAG: hypothetical protein ACO32S_04590 [Steroidobacteraceae bacterium]